jgi:hypothetical protein
MRSVVEVMIDVFLYRPPKYTPEERRQIHSETGRRVMASRAMPQEILDAITQAYLEEDLTAQQVGDRFGLPKSTIRGIINRAYAGMSTAERNRWKRRHGSAVRTGERNANYGWGQSEVLSHSLHHDFGESPALKLGYEAGVPA